MRLISKLQVEVLTRAIEFRNVSAMTREEATAAGFVLHLRIHETRKALLKAVDDAYSRPGPPWRVRKVIR